MSDEVKKAGCPVCGEEPNEWCTTSHLSYVFSQLMKVDAEQERAWDKYAEYEAAITPAPPPPVSAICAAPTERTGSSGSGPFYVCARPLGANGCPVHGQCAPFAVKPDKAERTATDRVGSEALKAMAPTAAAQPEREGTCACKACECPVRPERNGVCCHCQNGEHWPLMNCNCTPPPQPAAPQGGRTVRLTCRDLALIGPSQAVVNHWHALLHPTHSVVEPEPTITETAKGVR